MASTISPHFRSGRAIVPSVWGMVSALRAWVCGDTCVHCGAQTPVDAPLCALCFETIEPWDETELELGGLPDGHLRALGTLGESLASWVLEAKSPRGWRASRKLGVACRPLLSDVPPGAVLVPVPSRFASLWRRGFGTTWVMANAMAAESPLSVHPFLRFSGSFGRAKQAHKNKTQRWRDLPRFRWVHREPPPEHCILVDDVRTTGATLHAAQNALREAGARRCDAVVAACAETPVWMRANTGQST